ncbi:hypothetical protein [Candidatus Nitrosocosmicus sp. R]
MNSKIIATIVIISMLAGFTALVGQISQQVSATSMVFVIAKGQVVKELNIVTLEIVR